MSRFDWKNSPSEPNWAHLVVKVRRQHCLSQLQLAKILGCHPMNISKWERRVARPISVFQTKLYELLRIPPTEAVPWAHELVRSA